MGDFLRSTLANAEAIVASALATYDLPVNPLSCIFYTLGWQDGAALGNTGDPVAEALSFIGRVEVLHKGQAIVSCNGADLAFMGCALTRRKLAIQNLVDAAAERHFLTLIIPFGRRLYDGRECFPATRRGELQLQIASTAAVGTVDTPTHTIETVELLDVQPQQTLKYTTISKTPTAAGEHDVDLPIGNACAGIGLFATTVPTGASANRSIGDLRMLVDNVETRYGRTNWESFQAETWAAQGHDPVMHRHTHAQAAAADVVTGMQLYGIVGPSRYAFLDLDPRRDDSGLLQTEGRSRVHLRINAEGVADAIRVIPVEVLRKV